jgi:hypothetical protein
MEETDLAELAVLLRERNLVDERIGWLINRPMTAGHAGEWIASRPGWGATVLSPYTAR